MSRELDAAEVADLLADGGVYRSKVVVRATRVSEDSSWTTGGGDVMKAEAGDWWVTDGDDHWSVADDVFVRTYESLGDGRYRKSATVTAVSVGSPFSVQTLEGTASGEAGDWLVRNPTGVCWPVAHAVFNRRYDRTPQDR